MLNDYDKMNEEEKKELLSKVAHMYYNENKTQSEIAEYFSTTRFKVSKWIQDARNKGIVEITIHTSNNRNTKLENIFKENFALNNVIILNNQFIPYEDTLRQLGKLGAEYLNRIITPDSIIGVLWGKTVYNIINQININDNQFVEITAVQIVGNVAKDNPILDSPELIKNLAAAYNGKYKFLLAPLYIQDDYIRKGIIEEPVIKDAIEYGKKANIILTGIGGQTGTSLYSNIWERYRDNCDLESTDAVGSIYGRLFDKSGTICDISANKKVVGVDMESILNIKYRIGIVVGKHKTDATIGALKGNLINVLITDRDVAISILKKLKINFE